MTWPGVPAISAATLRRIVSVVVILILTMCLLASEATIREASIRVSYWPRLISEY